MQSALSTSRELWPICVAAVAPKHLSQRTVLHLGDIFELQHDYSEECNATAMSLSMLSPVMAGFVVVGPSMCWRMARCLQE